MPAYESVISNASTARSILLQQVGRIIAETEALHARFMTTGRYVGRTALIAPDFNTKMFAFSQQGTRQAVNDILSEIGGIPYQYDENGTAVTRNLRVWGGLTDKPGIHTWFAAGVIEPLELHTHSLLQAENPTDLAVPTQDTPDTSIGNYL